MISADSQPRSANPGSCDGDQPNATATVLPRPLADIESGRIVSNDYQTVYVSGSHWASISYEVSGDVGVQATPVAAVSLTDWSSQLAEIRDHFDQETQTEAANILDSNNVDGPLILDASETSPDLDSILSDIPPKDIASKLVSRYFNGVEFPTGRSFVIFVMRYSSDGA